MGITDQTEATAGSLDAEDYLFDTGSDLGAEHVAHLEMLLDEATTRWLEGTGVGRGQRCLEIGAGGGSIARWMADRVGPSGRVVATEIEPKRVQDLPGVELYRSDITEGLPVDGPFDLIHARLVLAHLPRREQILAELVRALAPGGWLVLTEFSDRPMHVIAAPDPSARELFERIQHLSTHVVSPAGGISWQWAAEVPERMMAAGLVDVQALEHAQTTSGGMDGCLLHRNLNVQAEAPLLQAGASPEELERYRALMLDPRFTAWFNQLICTRGRRPA